MAWLVVVQALAVPRAIVTLTPGIPPPLVIVTLTPGIPPPREDHSTLTPQHRPAIIRKGPCRAHRFNQKAVEISNLFRQALGLPLIKPAHDDGKVRALPFIGTHTIHVDGKEMEGGAKLGLFDAPTDHPHPHPHPHGHHPHGSHRGHHRHGRKGSFINRIHHSLMNLGRWEGRAVAFVLGETAPFFFAIDCHAYLFDPGCGIGVLLRMAFVLALVMYRAVKGQRGEDQHEYSQITIIEEIVDTPKSSPPSYPVDEKVPIVIETVKAPSTTEENK